MTTPSKVLPGISLLLLLLISTVSWASSVLYDNGPDSLSFSTADLISFSPGSTTQLTENDVTDSFTLTATSTLTRISFAEVTLSPNGGPAVPTLVNYHIGTRPFGTIVQPFPGGGCCQALAGTGGIGATFIGNAGSLQDYRAEFSLPDFVLPAGTYYLTLDAASDTSSFPFKDYWALTDAASGDAMFRTIDGGTGATSTGDLNNEVSFQIYGMVGAPPPPTGVPEPGTWGLLLLGMLALGLLRRRSSESALAHA